MTEPSQPHRILITGGTSGIGFAAARRFLREPGTRIVVNGRDPARGEAARARLLAEAPEASVDFIAADVGDPEAATRLVREALDRLGGSFDLLVHAAGGDHAPTLFHELPLAEADAIIRHWLLSTIYCCRLVLPHLSEGGAIVAVASDAARVPTPGEAVIGAAMAGVTMFCRTLAMEAKRRGIRVNVVTPSLVSNTLTHERVTAGGFSAKLFEKAAAMAHLGLPEPDDVAAAIVFLAGPESRRTTGQILSVNGGISAGL